MPFKDKNIDMFLSPCNTVTIMKGHIKVPNQETSPKADSQCRFWEHGLPR